jgi:hypothetical protein
VRAVFAVLILTLVGACATVQYPTPAPVVWGNNVPEAAAEAIASQPVLDRKDGRLTLLPISPTGAVVGNAYGYRMPLCGIRSPIDVDGSFWDAVDIPAGSANFDQANGTFLLTSPTTATFTASHGPILQLVRHAGPKEFGLCF